MIYQEVSLLVILGVGMISKDMEPFAQNGSQRKELMVKAPLNAVEKWFEYVPEIFKENALFFKAKILVLNKKVGKLAHSNLLKINN